MPDKLSCPMKSRKRGEIRLCEWLACLARVATARIRLLPPTIRQCPRIILGSVMRLEGRFRSPATHVHVSCGIQTMAFSRWER